MAEYKGSSPQLHKLISAIELGLATDDLLSTAGRGIEKESLRVTREGNLSQKTHPISLGSPLTHPNITTDFSEAQLELITSVHNSPEALIEELDKVHRFTYQHLESEILWTSSMPCDLVGDQDIPIGRYGNSNIALAKNIYRRGLGNRYGRLMQTISGIHYNFSLPKGFWKTYAEACSSKDDQKLRDQAYFALIRNFRRYSWLLIYLFGASPAVCKSFVRNNVGLESMDKATLYLPYSTSLRMGKLGYQSEAQSSLHISYNSLENYNKSMREALTTAYPPYKKIGIKKDGEYQQLNEALLQIENEFYGSIRPKRRVASGERPLTALNARGVEYVEVRCLDLNPFLVNGIDVTQVKFLDLFLLFCLLTDSPKDSKTESASIQYNQLRVVEQGRDTSTILRDGSSKKTILDWAAELLEAAKPIASLLDKGRNRGYLEAWKEQKMKLAQPNLTPSGSIIAAMQGDHKSFLEFSLDQSKIASAHFEDFPLPHKELMQEREIAKKSLMQQKMIESEETESFEIFLNNYLSLP